MPPVLLALAGCVTDDAPTPAEPESVVAPAVGAEPGMALRRPHAFVWRNVSPDGSTTLYRPLRGAQARRWLVEEGYEPLRMRFAPSSNGRTLGKVEPAPERAGAETAGAGATCFPDCVHTTTHFNSINTSGRTNYVSVMRSTNPIVEEMHAIVRPRDEVGYLGPAQHRFAPGPGYWATEFPLPPCSRNGESYTVRSSHLATASGGGDIRGGSEIDTFLEDHPCPWDPASGGSRDGGGDLFVEDGPAGSWMCGEYDLDPGTWEVYIDGVYAGTIVCDE